jgi:hypothetical protein
LGRIKTEFFYQISLNNREIFNSGEYEKSTNDTLFPSDDFLWFIQEQFLKNGSIETQVKRIKAFANENGLRITREFDAEFESSKRINTQKTLNELIKAVKTTAKSQRPKVILIWSPADLVVQAQSI